MGCLFIVALILDIARGIYALTTLELSPFWRTFDIILLVIEVLILLGLLIFGGGKIDGDQKDENSATTQGQDSLNKPKPDSIE